MSYSNNKEITKSVRQVLAGQKFNYLTSDPENTKGHEMIRQKFGIAEPNQFKFGRSQGGIS
jgi:hypothetical protein